MEYFLVSLALMPARPCWMRGNRHAAGEFKPQAHHISAYGRFNLVNIRKDYL